MVNYIIGAKRKISDDRLRRWWYDNCAMSQRIPAVHISKTPSARVEELGAGTCRLEIPASAQGGYRLAQLDSHGTLPRRIFPWHPPLTMNLRARASSQDIPGTWGFGYWNEPFGFLLGSAGMVRRLPTLPQAVWFFHASPENYLSFRDDLPANGFLAATFKSKNIFPLWLALASPALVLTLVPGAAQVVRRALRKVIHQDAAQILTDVTTWHTYTFRWETSEVRFYLDGMEILRTAITPFGPLSPVIWVDNQYASLPPIGKLKFGNLPNPEPAWLEVREMSVDDKA